jgi:hypothetical protein
MTFDEALEKFKRLRDSIQFLSFGWDHPEHPYHALHQWSDDPEWAEFVNQFQKINEQVVPFNRKYGL